MRRSDATSVFARDELASARSSADLMTGKGGQVLAGDGSEGIGGIFAEKKFSSRSTVS